jgi:predicted phosphodiesterase
MKYILLFAVLIFTLTIACQTLDGNKIYFQKPSGSIELSFVVTSDMRSFTGKEYYYFRGICEMLNDGGSGDFMVSPGDIDPPDSTFQTINRYIGQDYSWYPVVGNHEADTESDMAWIREYNQGGNPLPNIIRYGPLNGTQTTFSFEYGEAHFIVLNEYYDGQSDIASDGDVGDELYQWLASDLQANNKPLIFVFGHEPAYPMPDQESGRMRHENTCLDKYPVHRDRFWQLLADYQVLAYLCGHTHNYSVQQFNGVWQIDAGHARGIADSGARSTFIIFYIMDNLKVWYYTYRMDFMDYNYKLVEYQVLN